MKWPLVVLAVGTVISSSFLFRDVIADSAAHSAGTAPLIAPLHGHEEAVHHAAHLPLTFIVWPSFVVGFLVAIAIYARGLGTADKPESQEICFVPDGDYAKVVERVRPDAVGRGGITGNELI